MCLARRGNRPGCRLDPSLIVGVQRILFGRRRSGQHDVRGRSHAECRGVVVAAQQHDVDAAVTEAFDTYKVVAFYFDPSHAKADDAVEDDRFWWPLVDDWHRRYSGRLNKKFWPIKSGPKAHSVAFDMLSPAAQALFQPAVTQLAEDLAEEGRARGYEMLALAAAQGLGHAAAGSAGALGEVAGAEHRPRVMPLERRPRGQGLEDQPRGAHPRTRRNRTTARC